MLLLLECLNLVKKVLIIRQKLLNKTSLTIEKELFEGHSKLDSFEF